MYKSLNLKEKGKGKNKKSLKKSEKSLKKFRIFF